MSHDLVSIDDADARIHYGPRWELETEPSTSTAYFNHTYHSSEGQANLTLEFTFTGANLYSGYRTIRVLTSFAGVSLTLYGVHTHSSSNTSSPHHLTIDETSYDLYPPAQQGVLFSSTVLDPDVHRVRLVTGHDSLHFDRIA